MFNAAGTSSCRFSRSSLYYNLLNLGQSWHSGTSANFYRFMLLLHGGVFVVASAWLFKWHFQSGRQGIAISTQERGVAAG
ncbi:MAG: hypothetical protein IPI20_07405 [Rhodoferax sp.]|nr:hypothetical protein [Rhodoferax sp.]